MKTSNWSNILTFINAKNQFLQSMTKNYLNIFEKSRIENIYEYLYLTQFYNGISRQIEPAN